MIGTRGSPGVARRAVALAVLTGMLLMLMAGVALAGGKSVTIKEIDERYHFTPNDITVAVGDKVTWSNDSDAPHTVTSNDSGGPLDGSLNGEGDTYSATFDTAGDYAYHCVIHSYMHGVVHVNNLPSTDITGAGSTSGSDSGGSGIVTVAAIAGAALGAAGLLTFVLRRRAIRA
jgi:plastocyanin